MLLARRDYYGLAGALFLHGCLAAVIFSVPERLRHHWSTVEFQVQRRQPPPLPPPPREPPKPRTKPRPAFIPNETPKKVEPTTEPPKPVFGVSQSSTTTGDSSFAVPVGNTTVADPRDTAPAGDVKPLPLEPPPPPPPPSFRPASPLEIKEQPEVIGQSCDIPSRLYPEEARQQGIEGDTDLRVEVEASGKVRSVRVVTQCSKMLDNLAVYWMQSHCQFKPARNSAGQPVDYVDLHLHLSLAA